MPATASAACRGNYPTKLVTALRIPVAGSSWILVRGRPPDTDDGVTLVACFAHCRRYFFEAALCRQRLPAQPPRASGELGELVAARCGDREPAHEPGRDLRGSAGEAPPLAPAVPVTARTLESTHAKTLGSVAIDVEEIVDSKITFVDEQLDDKRLLLGKIGNHFLPIIVAREDGVPERHLTGQLQSSVGTESSQPWLEAVHEDAALDAATFDYYLDLTYTTDWRMGLFGFVTVIGTLALWGLWFRAWVRRRRTRRASA